VPHSILLLSTMVLATATMATQWHEPLRGPNVQPAAQPLGFSAFAASGETRTSIFTSETTKVRTMQEQRWVF